MKKLIPLLFVVLLVVFTITSQRHRRVYEKQLESKANAALTQVVETAPEFSEVTCRADFLSLELNGRVPTAQARDRVVQLLGEQTHWNVVNKLTVVAEGADETASALQKTAPALQKTASALQKTAPALQKTAPALQKPTPALQKPAPDMPKTVGTDTAEKNTRSEPRVLNQPKVVSLKPVNETSVTDPGVPALNPPQLPALSHKTSPSPEVVAVPDNQGAPAVTVPTEKAQEPKTVSLPPLRRPEEIPHTPGSLKTIPDVPPPLTSSSLTPSPLTALPLTPPSASSDLAHVESVGPKSVGKTEPAVILAEGGASGVSEGTSPRVVTIESSPASRIEMNGREDSVKPPSSVSLLSQPEVGTSELSDAVKIESVDQLLPKGVPGDVDLAEVLKDVRLSFGRSEVEVGENQEREVMNLAIELLKRSTPASLVLTGRYKSGGDEENAKELARQRAGNVRKVLSEYGIDPDKIAVETQSRPGWRRHEVEVSLAP